MSDQASGQPSGAAAGIPYYIGALLPSGAAHWGNNGAVLGSTSVGAAATVRFAFATSSSQLSGADAAGFAPMNTTQKAMARQALATWSAVANLTFVETASVGDADVTFATNQQHGASSAYTYLPSTAAQGGQIFIANDAPTNTNPTPGNYGFFTLVHEIGHALGLKHPGNYNAASSSGEEGPYLPSAEDNHAYSVMSYNRNSSLPSGTYLTGPSIDDVAAIQYLYGTKTTAGAGDTHTLAPTTFTTIWDPNGTNTLDGSGQTANETIDLREGRFSTVGGTLSVGLAFGTRIRNALGGAGNDTVYVNGLADRIDGSGGSDTVVFSGPRAQYTLTSTGANSLVVSGGSADCLLLNVETLQFSDGSVSLPSGTAGTSFDALRYLCSNPDLMAAFGMNQAVATNHYLTVGFIEGRSFTRFVALQYVAANADLITAFGTNILVAERHYITNGRFESRSTTFDAYRYLAGYSDLMNAFGTDTAAAMTHYITYGKAEGRSVSAFDPLAYLASNPDLIAAFGMDFQSAEQHYITNGRFESRPLNSFDAAAYLAANADVMAAVGNDLTAAERHYVMFGYNEHRTTGAVSALAVT